MEQNQLILGYWSIRGLAEPIRLLLEYLGLPYKEIKYHESQQEEWFEKEKLKLKSDFPNLPYLIDGENIITESDAVLVYIAQKAKKDELLGLNNLVRFTQLKGVVIEQRTNLTNLYYNPDFDNAKKEVFENVQAKFKLLSKVLDSNKYLLGDQITYIDFILYETATVLNLCDASVLGGLTVIQNFLQRIEQIPNIKAYLASNRFNARPINWSIAKFT